MSCALPARSFFGAALSFEPFIFGKLESWFYAIKKRMSVSSQPLAEKSLSWHRFLRYFCSDLSKLNLQYDLETSLHFTGR